MNAAKPASTAALSYLWITFFCAVMICLLIATGCNSVSDADLESLDGQLAAWRLVHDEGKTWTDAQWDGRLAGYAAEIRTLRAKLGEDVKGGDYFRFKAEEKKRHAGP